MVLHEIDTGDATPIRERTRPIPLGARQEFKGIISDLLERGIIEKRSSEWASPVVQVRKKDGTLLLCMDYRALNKVTKQDAYPQPTVDLNIGLSGRVLANQTVRRSEAKECFHLQRKTLLVHSNTFRPLHKSSCISENDGLSNWRLSH